MRRGRRRAAGGADRQAGRLVGCFVAVDRGRKILRCLPFFKTFRPEELREFLDPLKRYEFSPGQVVYAEGAAARSCLVIVRGALSMSFSTGAGTSMFSVHGPGRMVGVLPLVDGGPHPLACLAREETIAFAVERFDGSTGSASRRRQTFS
jgi:CRP-like cAMP-binding protein